MAESLSAYWVKFFKGAGFPQDVATKHAVVFSNNRIKPDMLPDLDKPSLKEMGITLMGDMIAILRYAKKVVEDTTCERFLVDSEDSVYTRNKVVAKPTVKKIVKVPGKTIVPAKSKAPSPVVKTVAKSSSSTTTKPSIVKKVTIDPNKINLDYEKKKQMVSVKRKVEQESTEYDDNNEGEWTVAAPKRLKTVDDNVGYKVVLPKGSTTRSRQLLKKAVEQKRTVFDRLGDSSVTSTTNLAEAPRTFNITGLGKDVLKRSSSVFNRLGNKDGKKDEVPQSSVTLKNGVSNKSQGILKSRNSSLPQVIVTTTKNLVRMVPKSGGTMRADQELHKKTVSDSVKQLVRTSKQINFKESLSNKPKMKLRNSTGKLASERLTVIPAKERLGTGSGKQVTFNRIATVTHVKKADVFSRLGI